MEIKLLDEPLLQFGKGEYVCPRTGIYSIMCQILMI